jgi:IPT/TIG domain-containing protein
MERQRYRLLGGRRALRAGVTLAATLTLGLLLPAAAGATVVTIGTPTGSFSYGQNSAGCNCTQYQLTAPAGYVETAPAAGVITAWRVAGAGTLTLEVLRTAADGSLSIVGESGGGSSASTGGVPAQPVHIPVLAGDSIGVHLSGTSPKVFNTGPALGGTIGEAAPDVPATFPNLQTPGGALDLNADITLTPQISSVSPASGPTGGTNLVTITGQYLDGVTSVRFGGIPAAFTVLSPTEITAYGPLEGPGVVDVTVTGPAATSATSAADQFDFLPKATGIQSPSGSAAPGTTGGSALVLSPLSLSASYFLAAPSGASIATAKPAVGTRLSYTVSAPATTSFVIQEALAGRLLPATSAHAKRVCVAPNEATLPQKLPACARYVSLTPRLTHTGPAGRTVVHLSGRLNGHVLAPGSYRLVATATSTATPTVTSAQVTHAFHILAPPKPAKPGAKPKAHAALPS